MVASNLFKHLGHVAHELKGIKFLDIEPFVIFTILHGPQELVFVIIPFLAVQRANLAGIVTAHNMK